jgi:hypothetical protein
VWKKRSTRQQSAGSELPNTYREILPKSKFIVARRDQYTVPVFHAVSIGFNAPENFIVFLLNSIQSGIKSEGT